MEASGLHHTTPAHTAHTLRKTTTMKYNTAHLYKLAAQHGMKVDDSDPTCWYVDSPPFYAFEVTEEGTPSLSALCADWDDPHKVRPWVTKGTEIDDLVRRLMAYIKAGFEEITMIDPAYPDPENWPKPEEPGVFS